MAEPGWLSETRASYDVAAGAYAERADDLLTGSPIERAMLTAFAELVGPGGRVADLGCGPGHVTAMLAGLGLNAFGIDLSPGMLERARGRHPELNFTEGAFGALPIGDGGLDGALARYSLIHVPPDQLPEALADIARVLRPGGQLLAVFQVGEGPRRIDSGFGVEVALDLWLRQPDEMEELLTEVGLRVHTRVLRDAEGHEKAPRASLLAVRD